ncbi:hypothetical protein BP6252_13785 [Coleophoma cylindrospora]|uniref:DUF803-domain-containing protein n=1 Tax=Coleophoma cylindrospora TaxID=1849047 RepID=A0A3D8Q6X9_9HELO|nr:hypothetical protein BP6252_13785 [Coleophoma cylindrospora]
MLNDEYIGVALAVCGSGLIGSSYVTTKIGLRDASDRHGFKGDGFEYVKNPLWWTGMIMLVIGELFNFAAYAFAPAVLVTPLGALSVLTGTVLGAYFLEEKLGRLGKLGCVLCLVGSVQIVTNAPADKEIQTVDEILGYAMQPVCAATGAVSVMALKAFGIALKLTFAGANQFARPSTYLFALVAILCIVVQMNYFNKALSTFPQSIVSPIYYVTFTTTVLTASFVLFQGFNMANNVQIMQLLCGFLIIFCGVYMLNIPSRDTDSYEFQMFAGGAVLDSPRTTGRFSLQGQRASADLGEPNTHV